MLAKGEVMWLSQNIPRIIYRAKEELICLDQWAIKENQGNGINLAREVNCLLYALLLFLVGTLCYFKWNIFLMACGHVIHMLAGFLIG